MPKTVGGRWGKPTYFKKRAFLQRQGEGGGANYSGDGLEGYALSVAYAKSSTTAAVYGIINALNDGRAKVESKDKIPTALSRSLGG